MIEIIPTCVARDESDVVASAEAIRAYASAIHLDVDDGVFAPVVSWPYDKHGAFKEFELSATAGLFVEVHLMVEEPREIGVHMAHAGADRIIAHIEGFADTTEAHGALEVWRRSGAKEVGLGLLLATPFEVIEPLISACDVVHLMSIATIGTQGIPYDIRAPARIVEFHRRFPDTVISVDGGVSEKNIAELARAGATRFGVGSAISKAPDPKAKYDTLKTLAEDAARLAGEA